MPAPVKSNSALDRSRDQFEGGELTTEVYGKDKMLFARVIWPRSHIRVYSADQSEWPTLTIHPGFGVCEELPVWPLDRDYGKVPPGTYYFRVAFPFETNVYYASNLYRFEVH